MTVFDGASTLEVVGALDHARATFRVGLLWAMGFIAGAYLSALTLSGLGWGPAKGGWYETVVNGWLGVLTMWRLGQCAGWRSTESAFGALRQCSPQPR